MKKLIICHHRYGDKTIIAEADIKTEFEKIMKEGYGNKIPAIFHVDYNDGKEHNAFTGKDATSLIDDPTVEEVVVIAPLSGG